MSAPLHAGDAAAAMGGWEGVAFADLRPGDLHFRREFTVGIEELRRFRACLGESVEGPGPHRVPAFLLNEFRTVKAGMRLPPGVLHASERVEMRRAVLVDEPLVATVEVSDCYIRNGKRFVVMRQELSTPAAPGPALRITRTLFWPC